MIKLEIPMIPKAKQSTRFANGHSFSDPKVVAYANNFKAIIYSQLPAGFQKLEGPIFVEYLFLFERPKSWSKKKAAETLYKITKPDADNLQKAVNDSLNDLVIHDDACIVGFTGYKLYSSDNKTILRIWSKDEFAGITKSSLVTNELRNK